MIIDEAIKNLEELEEYGRNKGWDDWEDAIKLGIEALKFYKALRSYDRTYKDNYLPGESE